MILLKIFMKDGSPASHDQRSIGKKQNKGIGAAIGGPLDHVKGLVRLYTSISGEIFRLKR